MEALEGETFKFKATIKGDFPKDAYPTETDLKLKVGAQVMFVKNDSSAEKHYYNGKIGTVSRIDGHTVFVGELAVEALEWSNIITSSKRSRSAKPMPAFSRRSRSNWPGQLRSIKARA